MVDDNFQQMMGGKLDGIVDEFGERGLESWFIWAGDVVGEKGESFGVGEGGLVEGFGWRKSVRRVRLN